MWKYFSFLTPFKFRRDESSEWKGKVWLNPDRSIAQRKISQFSVTCWLHLHVHSSQLGITPGAGTISRTVSFMLPLEGYEAQSSSCNKIGCATESKVHALESAKAFQILTLCATFLISGPSVFEVFFNQNHVANTRPTLIVIKQGPAVNGHVRKSSRYTFFSLLEVNWRNFLDKREHHRIPFTFHSVAKTRTETTVRCSSCKLLIGKMCCVCDVHC